MAISMFIIIPTLLLRQLSFATADRPGIGQNESVRHVVTEPVTCRWIGMAWYGIIGFLGCLGMGEIETLLELSLSDLC